MAGETKIINRFDAGMTADPRESDFRYCRVVKNFDIGTYATKLVPYRSAESGNANANTDRIQNFTVALRTGTTYSLYGLGLSSGKPKVFYKNLTASTTTDLDDDDWASATNGDVSGATAGSFETFVYYKNQGEIYGARDSRYLFAFSPTGTAMVDSEYDHGSAWANITEGLVHSKDDICYIGIDNIIISKNGAAGFATALTLPADKRITSLCEYGDYLAIAAEPISGVGKSVVYLWDRDSTLSTLSEVIDWGEGSLQIIEEIEGHIIGISIYSRNTSLTAATFQSKLTFRQYAGGEALVFAEIISDQANNQLRPYKQKSDQYLYFTLAITIDSQLQQGVWKIGRVKPTDPFAVSIDRTLSNDDTGLSGPNGFYKLGDYMFIAYTDVTGTTYYLSKTKDSSSYTATSSYESLKITGEDISTTKKLDAVTIMTEFLPAGASVLVKYKKDEETSWTTILTHDTDDEIRLSAINIQSTGVELPTFKELQFQITSTGGGVITGLKYKYTEIKDDIYG